MGLLASIARQSRESCFLAHTICYPKIELSSGGIPRGGAGSLGILKTQDFRQTRSLSIGTLDFRR